MSKNNMLRNQDFTDRELLHIVEDLAGEDGFTGTADIADRVFGNKKQDNDERRNVGSRMAWMVRYKFCEKHPEEPGRYRVTPAGRDLMGGRLTKTIEKAMEKMSDGDRALLLRGAVGSAFARTGPQQDFMKREYEYAFKNRRVAKPSSNGRGIQAARKG